MESRHSLLGIASFLLSVAAGAATFGLFVLVLAVRALQGGREVPNQAAGLLFLLLLVALLIADVVALGLGIAGLMQPERKKLFAVLGTVFAAAQLVAGIVIIAATR